MSLGALGFQPWEFRSAHDPVTGTEKSKIPIAGNFKQLNFHGRKIHIYWVIRALSWLQMMLESVVCCSALALVLVSSWPWKLIKNKTCNVFIINTMVTNERNCPTKIAKGFCCEFDDDQYRYWLHPVQQCWFKWRLVVRQNVNRPDHKLQGLPVHVGSLTSQALLVWWDGVGDKTNGFKRPLMNTIMWTEVLNASSTREGTHIFGAWESPPSLCQNLFRQQKDYLPPSLPLYWALLDLQLIYLQILRASTK